MKDSSICFLSGSDYSVFNLTTTDRVANFCDKQPFLGSCKVLNRGYRHEMSTGIRGKRNVVTSRSTAKKILERFSKKCAKEKDGGGGGGGGGDEAYK